MITCAITGSTGVLGKRIRKYLPYKFYEFKKDITNKKEVEKWVYKYDFDIVIHCAALVPTVKVNKSYDKAFNINVLGTKNLVNSLLKKKNKPKWFFYASTSHVYKSLSKYRKINESNKTNPQNKYGKTKLIAENYLKKELNKTRIRLCIGRIFSFTDKLQKPPFVIPNITKKIKLTKKKIKLNNLNHIRDFLNTKDISNAINILRKNNSCGVYNIGSGNCFNLQEISLLIAKKYNKIVKFDNSTNVTYLISDNKKLSKLNWKPKKYSQNLNYFY